MKHDLAKLQAQFKASLDSTYDKYDLVYSDKALDRYTLELENSIVYKRGLLFESEIFPNQQPYDPVYDIHVMDKAKHLPIVYKRKYNLQRVKGRTLFVYHKFQWNIYHTFIHDCNSYLNCLLAQEDNLQYDNVFLFADNPMNRFIYDKFLSKPQIISDESFYFDELTVVNSGIVTYTTNLSVLDDQIKMIRDDFLKHVSTNTIKLFTYRTRGGRTIINIDKVKDYFQSKGFVVLSDTQLCELSLYDQATLYNSASEIFSIFDSSLYNLVYCKPNTRVVVAEPTYKHLEENEDAFEKICDILNITYIPILMVEPRQTSRNWRSIEYNIDVKALDEYFK